MQTKRATSTPQLWNRYSYSLNNPISFADPTGKDVSIKLYFQGDWTEEMKESVIKQVVAFWKSLNVGQVFVFDGSKRTHGNFFGRGRATVNVNSEKTGNSHAKDVAAGEFLQATELGLTESQMLTAIANAINHEVFTHQFGINSSMGLMDAFQFSRHLEREVKDDLKARYGTVMDSHASNDPQTRGRFINGPIPVHEADSREASERLGPLKLKEPRKPFF